MNIAQLRGVLFGLPSHLAFGVRKTDDIDSWANPEGVQVCYDDEGEAVSVELLVEELA